MGPKILIADDEPYIRLLIEQTLEDLEEQGVEILTASDGVEALEIFKAENPEIVFLDVMMPKLNGFEVCQTIKHELQAWGVYVVILTAKGQEYDRELGEKAGANAYITKPFDPDELIAMVEHELDL